MLRQVSLLGGFVAALACDLAAQSTGTPVFLAPYRSSTRYEFGASLSDPGAGQLAVEGFYRSGQRKYDFGFRAGLADQGSTTAFLAGADFRMRVIDQSESFPLDGAFRWNAPSHSVVMRVTTQSDRRGSPSCPHSR